MQTIISNRRFRKRFRNDKQKCPEEVNYFNQFKKSCWKVFIRNWLSPHLEHGVSRTNNACERHYGCFKENFAFRKLPKLSEFLKKIKNEASMKVAAILISVMRHQYSTQNLK